MLNEVFKEKGIKTSFVLLPHEIQLDKILLEKYIKMWGINRNEIDVHYPTIRIVRELMNRKLNFFDPTKIMVGKDYSEEVNITNKLVG